MVEIVTERKMCVTFGDPKRQIIEFPLKCPELMHPYQYTDFYLSKTDL